MLNASLKSTQKSTINIKINCYEDVQCFLDQVEEDATSIASNSSAANEIVDEGVDSLTSSQLSDEQSDTYSSYFCSSDYYDPYESDVGYTFIPIVTNNSEEI